MSEDGKPPQNSRRRRRRRGGRGGGEGGDGPPAAERPRSDPQAGEGEAGRGRRRRRRGGRGRDDRGDRAGRRPERERSRDRDRDRDRPRAPVAPAPPTEAAVDDGWDSLTPVPADAAAEAPEPAPRDERWGDDADAPTPEVTLGADLPADPADDDLDPVSEVLEHDEHEHGPTKRSVRNVVGVKYHSAGKIYRFDGGDERYARGEQVIVETERGTRVGIVALPSVRRPLKSDNLKRILRRPSDADRSTADRNAGRAAEALKIARDVVRQRRMDIKLFRAEYSFGGTKLLLYFSSEKRIDFRDLARDLNRSLRTRLELRQTGVRDEAKLVGGIGSCGLELCCTTFLPSFAPVSIKMAKDQGLVLNPHKVSGQCGRLKCCLVYEQDIYAQMRKGLPKLGKRVIVAERGEGRVIEVDVLRQRIRVSFGPGDFDVFPAEAVAPMFPSQPQGKPETE